MLRQQPPGTGQPGVEKFFQITAGFPLHPVPLIGNNVRQHFRHGINLQHQLKTVNHRSQIGTAPPASDVTLHKALLHLL